MSEPMTDERLRELEACVIHPDSPLGEACAEIRRLRSLQSARETKGQHSGESEGDLSTEPTDDELGPASAQDHETTGGE
jgi:hypothetical protein